MACTFVSPSLKWALRQGNGERPASRAQMPINRAGPMAQNWWGL